jgi:hypothetical protein
MLTLGELVEGRRRRRRIGGVNCGVGLAGGGEALYDGEVLGAEVDDAVDVVPIESEDECGVGCGGGEGGVVDPKVAFIDGLAEGNAG